MGVIIPQVIEINTNNRYNQYYYNKGYFITENKKFLINIEDLQEKSALLIKCQCEYCKNIFTKSRCKIINLNDITVCKNCLFERVKSTNIKKYGAEFPWQSKVVQDGIKDRNFKKYGTTCTFQLEEQKIKTREKLQEKYGVDNIAKLPSTIDKMKKTNMIKYGVEFPIQNKEICLKIQQSYFNTQGKNFNNDFIACSKNQYKISELLNGEINKNIEAFFVDIVLDNKIIIEYDGGAHDLRVKTGHISRDKFIFKEYNRENILISCGYKIIRIISRRDYLLDDNLLIDLINNCKEEFLNSQYNIIFINILNKTKYEIIKEVRSTNV